MVSNSSEQDASSGAIVRTLFVREFHRALDRKGLQVLLLLFMIIMMVILTIEGMIFTDRIPFYYFDYFPLFIIVLCCLFFNFKSISGDHQSGIFEVIKMGPARPHQYLISKLLFGIFLYFFLGLPYIFLAIVLSISNGILFLQISLLIFFGPYLLFYLTFGSLAFLFSSIWEKNASPNLMGGMLSVTLLITSNQIGFRLFQEVQEYNPVYVITTDIVRFEAGSYPDPFIIGGQILLTLFFLFVTYLSLKHKWGCLPR